MDRKGIIAIALAITILLGWSQYYSRETQKLADARQAIEREEAAKKAAEAPASTPGASAADAGKPGAPAVVPAVDAEIETVPTPAVDYEFTNLGGGIKRLTLRKHLAEHGAQVELNQFGTIPIGALSEAAGEGTSLPYQMKVNAATGEVTFDRTDARQLQVTKKFSLPQQGAREEYLSSLEVQFTNRGPAALLVPVQYIYTGAAAPVHQKDLATYTGFGWSHGGSFKFKDSSSFGSGGFMGFGRTEAPIFQDPSGDVAWAGTADQYFTSVITPRARKGSEVWAHKFNIDRNLIGTSGPVAPPLPNAPPTVNVSGVEGALALPAFSLEPGKTEALTFDLYTGPREYSRLRDLGGGQEAIMNFGMFRAVSKVLLASMNWLHAHLGSYALAIVVLTLIIRGLMWPLQNKATQSMKRMQALQPEMNALKEKYADDPTRMNQELMKLYKVYQINPVAGCLPMFVQIPVFFGFYSMLGVAVELRNAHFLWVKDLSQPDTVAMIAGYPLNVLPLLMAVTMLGQMKLSPKSGDPVQQRVFMFMPVIFIAFCYNYASALALYWTVQNLFSIVQLYVTRNQATPVLQKIAVPAKKRRS